MTPSTSKPPIFLGRKCGGSETESQAPLLGPPRCLQGTPIPTETTKSVGCFSSSNNNFSSNVPVKTDYDEGCIISPPANISVGSLAPLRRLHTLRSTDGWMNEMYITQWGISLKRVLNVVAREMLSCPLNNAFVQHFISSCATSIFPVIGGFLHFCNVNALQELFSTCSYLGPLCKEKSSGFTIKNIELANKRNQNRCSNHEGNCLIQNEHI